MRPARRFPARAACGAAIIVATLAGCAVGPDFVRPAPPAATSFPHAVGSPDAAALPADWWTLLGSPALDALVDRALTNSPTLAAARATLLQAQELRAADAGAFLPHVDASTAIVREKTLTSVGGHPAAVGPYGVTTASASVGYSVDLFGGQRRQVEARDAEVARARADLESARVALAANVAIAALAHAGYVAQADALAHLAAAQDDQVRLAQAQVDSGLAAAGAVLALRVARQSTEASLATARGHAAQAATLLARLCGDGPGDATPPAPALADFHLPAPPPLEVPAAWAAHRPDIVGAEADLHAANARIGVATAAALPDLVLGGQDGRAAGIPRKLLASAVPFWSLQAALVGNLFDGGASVHGRRAAVAARDAAQAQYRQVVLVALEQVADTLQATETDALLLRASTLATADADAAVQIAQAQWEAGRAGYLDVLTADGQLQSSRLALVASTTQQLQDAVALYVALGGGWWNQAAPVAAAVPGRP